jgi:hypothetical protein
LNQEGNLNIDVKDFLAKSELCKTGTKTNTNKQVDLQDKVNLTQDKGKQKNISKNTKKQVWSSNITPKATIPASVSV